MAMTPEELKERRRQHYRIRRLTTTETAEQRAKRREYARKHYLEVEKPKRADPAYRERYREIARRSHAKNREKNNERNRLYRKQHPPTEEQRKRNREYNKIYYETVIRPRIAADPEYRKLLNERNRLFMRKYYHKYKEKYQKYREEHRDRAAERNRRHQAERAAAVEFLRSLGIDVPGTDTARYAALAYVRQIGRLPSEAPQK